MRIALDGMPLASPLTGVGHYTAELARNLAVVAPSDSFTFISPGGLLKRRWWCLEPAATPSPKLLRPFHGTNYENPFLVATPHCRNNSTTCDAAAY
jgi:hypothetical protein